MPTVSPSPLEAMKPEPEGAMPQPLRSVALSLGVAASASMARMVSPSGEETAMRLPSAERATEPT